MDGGPISIYYANRTLLPATTRVFVDFVTEAAIRFAAGMSRLTFSGSVRAKIRSCAVGAVCFACGGEGLSRAEPEGRAAPGEGWCGRGESNPHRPFSPTDFRTTTAFAAAVRRLWSGLSLRRIASGRLRRCPSSLYTFPGRGLARDRHLTGFPEFEQFCIRGFPRSTQSFKSVASTSFATPARPRRYRRQRKPRKVAKLRLAGRMTLIARTSWVLRCKA